jgi:peptidoglycan hydrolase CwlO-like protein
MFEYVEFYTKNLSNFTILLLIGAVIAILDITFRNVVKGVYLNVKDNIQKRHGISIGGDSDLNSGREGMENKGSSGDSGCPQSCSSVEALQSKLSGLIQNAAKLQKDIQTNNETIKKQQKLIENMQKSVEKMTKK